MDPYLSIIIPSRNDDHGENAKRRTAVSIQGLLEQLEKYQIESELILIDWNYPVDKPHLKEIIDFPAQLKYCTVRAIEVAPKIHQKLPYADKLPLYVVGAMNCGIRRARGKFILPSVIDLLYSDELMSFIAQKNLKENERYRVNRCDVDKGILAENSLKDQLEYCQSHIIKVHCLDKNYAREGLPSLHTDACGDFQLMAKKFWHLLRGYKEGDMISAYVDSLLSYASYRAGVKEIVLDDALCIYHIDHGDKFTDRMKVKKPFIEKIIYLFFNPWRSFLPIGISKKIVFWYQKVMGPKRKSEALGIPTLDYLEHLNLARDIVSGEKPYIFNDENWGLSQENLPESIIRKANWDTK